MTSAMTTLILTRHGHVEGIAPERVRGRADLPLTELGRRQARAVAARIADAWQPAAVYCSPLRRCLATGEAIATACGLEGRTLPALNDLDYGAWQGKTPAEVDDRWPGARAAWRASPHFVRFPGGESLQDVLLRTADALRLVLDRHPRAAVVLVAHDSVNRALLLQLLDQPLSAYWRIAQDPCAISEIEVADGAARAQRINESQHLAGLARGAAIRTAGRR
jgi:broad specificity phosphatase PhoE